MSSMTIARVPALMASVLSVSAFAGHGMADAYVVPYTPDASTALLFHMDDPAGTNVPTDATGTFTDERAFTAHGNGDTIPHPFQGAAGPAGLGTAATFSKGDQFTSPRLFGMTQEEADLFSTTNFTMEAWGRDAWQANTTNGIFQIRQYAADDNGVMERVDLRLAIGADGTATLRLMFVDAASEGAATFQTIISDTFTLEDDVWYHLAVTYDANTAAANDSVVTFYATPASDTSGVANPVSAHEDVADIYALTENDLRAQIGGADFNGAFNFGGDMDEFRYYNAALSAEDFNLVVPEPASLGLMMFGGACMMLRRRRRAG